MASSQWPGLLDMWLYTPPPSSNQNIQLAYISIIVVQIPQENPTRLRCDPLALYVGLLLNVTCVSSGYPQWHLCMLHLPVIITSARGVFRVPAVVLHVSVGVFTKQLPMFPDVPAGWRIPPRVHAGAVGAGEAASVAHSPRSRRRCSGLQSRYGGTEVIANKTGCWLGWVGFKMFIIFEAWTQWKCSILQPNLSHVERLSHRRSMDTIFIFPLCKSHPLICLVGFHPSSLLTRRTGNSEDVFSFNLR